MSALLGVRIDGEMNSHVTVERTDRTVIKFDVVIGITVCDLYLTCNIF